MEYEFNDLLDLTIEELESIKKEVLNDHAKILQEKSQLASDIMCIQSLNKKLKSKWQIEY